MCNWHEFYVLFQLGCITIGSDPTRRVRRCNSIDNNLVTWSNRVSFLRTRKGYRCCRRFTKVSDITVCESSDFDISNIFESSKIFYII